MADIPPAYPLQRGKTRSHQAPRASSIISNTSGGSVNDDFSDEDDDDDDDDDENIEGKY